MLIDMTDTTNTIDINSLNPCNFKTIFDETAM